MKINVLAMVNVCVSGTYLGYPKHPKYRVFIPSMSDQMIKSIEHTTSDPVELAKKLFQEGFKELDSRPDAVCCSGEGRELLNTEPRVPSRNTM